MNITRALFVTLLLLMVSFTHAENLNSSVNLGLGTDEQGNRNSSISVVIGYEDGKDVEFGAGSTEVPLLDATKTTSSYVYIGVSDKLNEDWRIGGTVESSGQRRAYNQLSINLPFTYQQDNYSIGLVPVFRHFTLTTKTNKKVRVTSPGFGLKGSIYPGDHFRFSGSIYNYNYSNDVSQLANFAISRFFSEKTLLLSSGFLKSSANLEAGLDFEAWSISLGRNTSVSAIDASRSNTRYLALDFYLARRWTLSLTGGQYEGAPSDEDNFSSVAVDYRF